jgi:hypothetical protein
MSAMNLAMAARLTWQGCVRSAQRQKMRFLKHRYLGVVLHHALAALLDPFCVLEECNEEAVEGGGGGRLLCG